MRPFLPLLALALLLPSTASAQLTGIAPGSRVRAVVPSLIPEPFTATLIVATPDSVWLQDARGQTAQGIYRAPRLAFRASQFTSVEVREPGDHLRGAVIGGLVGGAVSLVVALLDVDVDNNGRTVAGYSAGILIPIGAAVGLIASGEKWRRVYPAP